MPRATYRLQLHAQAAEMGRFDFSDARRAVRYLAALGIDTLYLSPPWQAAPQSMHGYDVTDHTQVSPELGGEKGLRALGTAAHAAGLGIVADFVPNHMGIAGGHNAYWEDVLRRGQASRYAPFFDIAWDFSPAPALRGKVLLPVLGRPYGQVLERGELQLEYAAGVLALRYFERLLPLSPSSYALVLAQAAPLLPAEQLAPLQSLIWQAQHLPPDPWQHAYEAQVLQQRVAQFAEQPAVAAALRAACGAFTAPEKLDELLKLQHYRLSYWRVAGEQINYRRFFDVSDLAALRMEDERVFAWAHSKLFELLTAGVLSGVRLDHTDGLHDPAGYFEQLQRAAQATGAGVYVVAEKILEMGESLPNWPLDGTTGYDFLAQVSALFVDPAQESALTQVYRHFTGQTERYAEVLHASKWQVQRGLFAAEMQVLAAWLAQLAADNRRWQDLTLSGLHQALREVVACFPVYRSYIRPDGQRTAADERAISEALEQARTRQAELDPLVFDFLEEVLLKASHPEYIQFVLKFQQLTGPIMAKGAEDTAFYRFARLLSLNEVGGNPAQFGLSPAAFHASMQERQRNWPRTMNALSTHDTKRGEDTRLRISVLAEMPTLWGAALREWAGISRKLGGADLHKADLYTLFQSLLGIWPLQEVAVSKAQRQQLTGRVQAYMVKALREGKERSGWLRPNEGYEQQLTAHIAALLAEPEFVQGVESLHALISPYAAQNSLSAALVRLTAPGVPDLYQGSEVWHQTLVDPDNRRPVDYRALDRQLGRVVRGAAQPLPYAQKVLAHYQSGEIKQFVTWAALQARQRQPEVMAGGYTPLAAGKYALAFERGAAQGRLVTVAPRLSYTLTRGEQPWALGEVWGRRTVKLSAGRYHNLLTGERLTVRGDATSLAKVLEHFPVALLVQE